MALPKVKKFLCCAPLETGGLFFGWTMMLISFFAMGFLIGMLALPSDIFYQTDAVVIISIYLAYFVVVFFASVLLVMGVSGRDETKLMPYMILLVVGILLAIIRILTNGFPGFFLAVLVIAIDIYIFLVVYSLYDKFRNEKLGIYVDGSTVSTQQVQIQFNEKPPGYIPEYQVHPSGYNSKPYDVKT